MRFFKALCLVLAVLMALGGGLAEAGEELFSENVDMPVEETELSLEEALIGAEDGAGILAVEEQVVELTAEPTEAPTEAPTVKPTVAPVQPEKIVVPENVVLGVGEKLRLAPVVEPADAEYGKITYKSSRSRYAGVSVNGTIVAKRKGSTVVTVKAGGVKAKVKVTVKPAPKKVSVKAERTTLNLGETLQLTAALPEGTTGSYTWSAEPEGIVSVSDEGLVTALKGGTATVTVKTYNKKKASVELTVRPDFEIWFLNIGRNDGILVRCLDEYAFFDSGVHSWGVKAANYMRSKGITRLKYYIGTHAHRDHVGGAPAILAAIPTDYVVVSHSGTARKIRDFAENDAERKATRAASYYTVRPGRKFGLGDAEFEVLGPINIVNCDTGDGLENSNSLVLKLTYGETTFLLTGDATGTELTQIEKANPGCLRATVLKNPHHNGKQMFALQKCNPQIVVFSTDNASQPAADVLRYITKYGRKYYITSPNRDGSVFMSSDGKELSVRTQY